MRRSASAAAAVVLAAGVVAALSGALTAAVPPPAKPPTAAEVAALARAPVRTSLASQRIYFVLPDRYANGDPSNDRGGAAGTRGVTGYDPADTAYFHGGDLRGLTGDCTGPRGLARLKDLGFTAVWVTPPFKQRTVQGSTAAYHGYWGLDFTTVDPHLGTDADFAAFVDCAHRLGLKVILDVVVNHTADVILLSGGASFLPPDEVPYRDCRGRAFNPARYATGKTFPCLSVTNMPRVPSVPAAERNLKKPAWLNDPTRYHDRGDIEFSSCNDVCYEHGDFFGLDDLFTEQPVVVNGLAAMYADWIRRYKLDGFRVDTARHVNEAFFRVWVPKVLAAARAAGVPQFELFGEVFMNDTVELSAFVRDRGLPNVLDFPLQDAIAGFAGNDTNGRAVAQRLWADDYFARADGVVHTPPTFLGNHDMGRAALKVQERSRAEGDLLLRRVLLAYDLLYFLRGAPVVYYGDEVGMIGRGGDQQARQDMFPTQVEEWRTQARVGGPPIGAGSSFDVASPIAARLRELARIRDAHPALATGATVVRESSRNVLALSRIDAATRTEYVALFNSSGGAARVQIATSTPSSTWTLLHGALPGAARSGTGGALSVELQPISSVLLRADGQLPAGAPARPTLAVGGDDLSELWRVTARVAGAGVSVAFALKRPGARSWRRLAADDSPPFRTFLDGRRFKPRERVSLVAIARGLDGRTAVSKVVPFVVRRR